MSTDIKYSIVKLNGDNYFNWRYKMKMLLIEKCVWDVIDQPLPVEIEDVWIKNDRKAHATIALNVEDNQIQHIRNCETARMAWKELKDFHEKDTANSRVSILRKLMMKRLGERDNVELHVNEMNELFQKLLAYGDAIEPEFLLSAILLGSLPASYDGLVAVLESRDEELNSNLVCSKVIDEYKRRQERNQEKGVIEISSTAMTVSSVVRRPKSEIDCYFCKEKGHYRQNCDKYRQWLENKVYQNEKANFAMNEDDGLL